MKTIIRYNDKYENIRDFVTHIPAVFEHQGQYVYGGKRNLIKNFTAPDGTVLCVKRYKKPSGINKYIYSAGIRQAKGLRAFLYPRKILAAGIETPIPVAYIENRSHGFIHDSYLFTLHCPYSHLMYEIGDADKETYTPVAHALAAFAADMHEKGIMHKDFSPGNILWQPEGENIRFAIVDINRMRFGKVSVSQGCAGFARLWGSKEFFVILARAYALKRHANPEDCVREILAHRKRFWTRYAKRHSVNYNLEL